MMIKHFLLWLLARIDLLIEQMGLQLALAGPKGLLLVENLVLACISLWHLSTRCVLPQRLAIEDLAACVSVTRARVHLSQPSRRLAAYRLAHLVAHQRLSTGKAIRRQVELILRD